MSGLIPKYIKSADVEVAVISSGDILSKIFADSFMHQYIPDIEILHKSSSTKTIKITRGKSSSKFTIKDDKALILFDDSFSLKDIISLIDYALEYWRQRQGIFTIHGAACRYEELGILIIGGASGIGKSSLVYNLCNNSPVEFISDEKVLINHNAWIVGGVKKDFFNKSTLDKSINTNKRHTESGCPVEKTQIKLILQPVISPDAKLIVGEWNSRKISWHLYEELSRKIRGTSRRVGRGFPIQSIDTEALALERSKLADMLAKNKNISALTVYGDVLKVKSYILKEILKVNRAG